MESAALVPLPAAPARGDGARSVRQPASSPASVLFSAREAPLSALDRLPRGLWLWSLVHSQGPLEARLVGVEAMLAALVAGRGTEASPWPDHGLAVAIAATLDRQDLPRYCADKPELAETVLRSLLWHLDLIVDYRDRGDDEGAAVARSLDAFAADWAERLGMLDELAAVFGELGDIKHERWDRLLGLLRSEGWRELVRISRLMEGLPELARVIRDLGRARLTEEPDTKRPSDVPVQERDEAPTALERITLVPDLPGETRGVTRSGRVARMLPAEAVLLLHPRLRLVWHARHAERALLSYEDDDRLREVIPRPASVRLPGPAPDKKREMGPLLVCVDTSGSMRGGAEAVAKAVVLEAVRTAHAQGRACRVYAFGGPGEVLEIKPALDVAGLERLCHFLGQSFRGGTDIAGPLEQALARLARADWRPADLLIASDGEFGATAELAERLRRAKADLGLRVQGVLIGDRETIGFLELADAIFWVRDWRRFGGSGADSPVHDKSLTALYFPGALRSPENRAATVGGEAAARAVRYGAKREKTP